MISTSTESMPAFSAAFAAIIFGVLAVAGWLQRHPALDASQAEADHPAAAPEVVLQPAG